MKECRIVHRGQGKIKEGTGRSRYRNATKQGETRQGQNKGKGRKEQANTNENKVRECGNVQRGQGEIEEGTDQTRYRKVSETQ